MAEQAPPSALEGTPPVAPEYTPPATQADLDRIISDRLARVKPKAPDDYKDLQAKAARLDELEAANRTELENAQTALAAATQRAEAAEQAGQLAKIHAAVLTEAGKLGAVDPEAVLALLSNDAVTIDDAGRVTGADTAVKALLESKPYLQSTPTAPTPPGFPPAPDLGQGSRGTPPALNSDALTQSLKRAVGAA